MWMREMVSRIMKMSKQERLMRIRTAVAALALAAGMTSFAMADITGKITLDGKAPEMKEINMSAVKECAAQHSDPVYEETVVADDKGGLANVIVAIKKEEGQDLPGAAPKEAAVLDQKGCMYSPHVLAVMAGQDFKVTGPCGSSSVAGSTQETDAGGHLEFTEQVSHEHQTAIQHCDDR